MPERPPRSCDVVVAGGSIAGLAAARELAARGASVLVLEEDMEVGTPEKCGGLVSMASFRELGVPPSGRIISQPIESAVITSRSGSELKMDVRGVGVVALRRRELDREMAAEASRLGAVVEPGTRVAGFEEGADGVGVSTPSGTVAAKYVVDARGMGVYRSFLPQGILPVVQYECYVPDMAPRTVEVHVDKSISREYFLWLIPLSDDLARVGVAGRGQLGPRLEDYLKSRGASVLKKVYHSLAVGGPIEEFVEGRRVITGEAAGQVKPTTAGGIYTAGVGGVIAGRRLADALGGDREALAGYREEWMSRFGDDFRVQLRLRKIFEDLGDDDVDALFDVLNRSGALEALADGSFDFHAADLRRLFGVSGFFRSLKVLAGSRARLGALLQLAAGV
ncbi:MAG: NAD(P)/FAD-dependent oxidoreductase [Nitrososphaerota archaeon]|nr:NAD(P)/FAD-dependent oxidoreductase [Nitrososphaerota archaeon]